MEDVYSPAAAWIMISGEVLHDLCLKGETSAETQSEEFNPVVWRTWKHILLELATQEDIDGKRQSLPRKAAVEMEQIEQRS
jgi:hypothetical protein